MNKAFAQLFVVIGCCALVAGPSQALCLDTDDPTYSAYRYPTIEDEVESSVAIVIATVTRVRPIYGESEYGMLAHAEYVYGVAAITRLSGFIPTYFEMLTSNTSGGFRMTLGESYLLFLREDEGRFWADVCGNSNRLEDADDTLDRVKNLLGKTAH